MGIDLYGKPRQEIEPSEWQTDENGRRYRMVGFIKEYEMTVSIDGHEIPQSEVEAYHERKKAREQSIKEAKKNAPAPPPHKFCPFANGLTTDCDKESCALYSNGCVLAQLGNKPPTKATEGMHCPFNAYHTCRKDCALFNNSGCALTAINKKARTVK